MIETVFLSDWNLRVVTLKLCLLVLRFAFFLGGRRQRKLVNSIRKMPFFFFLIRLLQNPLFEKSNNMTHFFTIRPQTNKMVVHLSKLHDLVISKIPSHNDLNLLVKMIQI